MIKLNFKIFILHIILCIIGFVCPSYLLVTSKIDKTLFLIMTVWIGLIITIITLTLNYFYQNINNLENDIKRINRKLDDKD